LRVPPGLLSRRGLNRERVIRTLTFWLRPAFVLRAVSRFQRIAGFDRALALASISFSAMAPLMIVSGAVLAQIGVEDAAARVVERYELTGGGAEAVEDLLSPASSSTSLSVFSALFVVLAMLSFTRAAQRLVEGIWERDALGVRNTGNALLWAGAFIAYLVATGWIHALVGWGRLELGASLLVLPLTAVFLVWGGGILSAKRIDWRDLVPFGVIGSALTAAFSVGATAYVPDLLSSYATDYGVIGAVLATISTLFCAMLVVVVSAVLGREVGDELDRIRRGERPPDHEVRQQWDNVIRGARARWQVAHEWAVRRHRKGSR
jgi:uncharacterized BrkB/YihY/UPF0761 family membrane protein